MQTFAPVRVVPAWSPSMRLQRPALSQQEPAPPVPGSVPLEQKPPFIDSALVATIMDMAGATATGILAYYSSYPGQNVPASRWSYFYLLLTGGFVVKGLADLSRVRTR